MSNPSYIFDTKGITKKVKGCFILADYYNKPIKDLGLLELDKDDYNRTCIPCSFFEKDLLTGLAQEARGSLFSKHLKYNQVYFKSIDDVLNFLELVHQRRTKYNIFNMIGRRKSSTKLNNPSYNGTDREHFASFLKVENPLVLKTSEVFRKQEGKTER